MRIQSFLEQSPPFQATRIARRIEASINRMLGEEGLTFLEALILAAVFFEKARVKPSQLALQLQTTRANISHSISSLEAKGLAQRKIDADDARAIQVVLLPAGRRRAARVVGILDRVQRGFEDGLGASKLQGTMAQLRAIEELCARLAKSG